MSLTSRCCGAFPLLILTSGTTLPFQPLIPSSVWTRRSRVMLSRPMRFRVVLLENLLGLLDLRRRIVEVAKDRREVGAFDGILARQLGDLGALAEEHVDHRNVPAELLALGEELGGELRR